MGKHSDMGFMTELNNLIFHDLLIYPSNTHNLKLENFILLFLVSIHFYPFKMIVFYNCGDCAITREYIGQS